MTLPLVAAEYDTPFGTLAVVVSPEDEVVRASGFRPVADMALVVAPAFRARDWQPGELPGIEAAIVSWLAGNGDALRAIPVEQDGGPFFQQVWATLRDVPFGETVSYQELAEAAGRPRAMRAAGTACARNNIAPFIPCHRVVKSGGALGNYGFGGVQMKAAMIAMEQGKSPNAADAATSGLQVATSS